MNNSSSSLNASWYDLQADRLQQKTKMSSSSSSNSMILNSPTKTRRFHNSSASSLNGGNSSTSKNHMSFNNNNSSKNHKSFNGSFNGFNSFNSGSSGSGSSKNLNMNSSFRSSGLDSNNYRLSNPKQSVRQCQNAMDMGQLPTDDDLAAIARRKRQRQLQKKKARERSFQKKKIRDRLSRIRFNTHKKHEHEMQLLEDESDSQSASESMIDWSNSNHDDDDKDKDLSDTITGGDEEMGFTGSDHDADDNSKADKSEKDEQKKKKKCSWFSRTFSIKPYKQVDILELEEGEEPPDPSCCQRYLSERNPCYDWYMVKDQLIGKRFDVRKSFCPTSKFAQIVKCVSTTMVVCAFGFSILIFEGPFISGYLAYLEHWGLLSSTAYMLLSMINSLLGAKQPWDVIEGRVRWSWMLFMVASHIEFIMTAVYWSLLYDPGVTRITYYVFVTYGGVAAQVFVDGFLINRIPLRWMFWWGMLWLLDIFYICYSLVYCFLLSGEGEQHITTTIDQNGNEHQNVEVLEPEPIYPFLDWKGDWESALVFSVIFICALSPAVHLFLWLASLYRWPFCFCCMKEGRRYLVKKKKEKEEDRRKREERRFERKQWTLRKEREREEAAMFGKEALHKQRIMNNSDGSLCDTTANESATWCNDSFTTGSGGDSYNKNGGNKNQASSSRGQDVQSTPQKPMSLLESHFAMYDISEAGEASHVSKESSMHGTAEEFLDEFRRDTKASSSTARF